MNLQRLKRSKVLTDTPFLFQMQQVEVFATLSFSSPFDKFNC